MTETVIVDPSTPAIGEYARSVLQTDMQNKMNQFGRLLEAHYQAQRNLRKSEDELKRTLSEVRELAATLDVKPELMTELIANVDEVIPTFAELEAFIERL